MEKNEIINEFEIYNWNNKEIKNNLIKKQETRKLLFKKELDMFKKEIKFLETNIVNIEYLKKRIVFWGYINPVCKKLLKIRKKKWNYYCCKNRVDKFMKYYNLHPKKDDDIYFIHIIHKDQILN